MSFAIFAAPSGPIPFFSILPLTLAVCTEFNILNNVLGTCELFPIAWILKRFKRLVHSFVCDPVERYTSSGTRNVQSLKSSRLVALKTPSITAAKPWSPSAFSPWGLWHRRILKKTFCIEEQYISAWRMNSAHRGDILFPSIEL